MNPGGDYGKKELSPALRNRFTEIWCEGCTQRNDIEAIIKHNLQVESNEIGESVARCMLDFLEWMTGFEVGKRFTQSIRDVLTWVNFINSCLKESKVHDLGIGDAYFHGANITYIDSLGSGLTSVEK